MKIGKNLKLDYKLNNMKMETILRKRKDHYVVTLYKKDRTDTDISIGDIIILDVNGYELVRPIRNCFSISLPMKLLKNKKLEELKD